jgi:hypothetical protein
MLHSLDSSLGGKTERKVMAVVTARAGFGDW